MEQVTIHVFKESGKWYTKTEIAFAPGLGYVEFLELVKANVPARRNDPNAYVVTVDADDNKAFHCYLYKMSELLKEE